MREDPKTFTSEKFVEWANSLACSGVFELITRSGYRANRFRVVHNGEKEYVTYCAYRYGKLTPKTWRRSLNLIERDKKYNRRDVDLKTDVVPAWCFETVRVPEPDE